MDSTRQHEYTGDKQIRVEGIMGLKRSGLKWRKSTGTSREKEFERQLGARIRAIRRARGLTMDSVAKRAGITKGFLSKVERGEKAPAISTLINVASAMNTGISRLLGSGGDDTQVSLVRKNERPITVRYASSFGYRYVALTRGLNSNRMEAFLIEFPTNPKRKGPGLKHPGEEFVFVLRGKILFTVGDQEFVLVPGDALYFDSSMPHWGRSVARRASQVLDISFVPMP